jgi:hypothetical protein
MYVKGSGAVEGIQRIFAVVGGDAYGQVIKMGWQ